MTRDLDRELIRDFVEAQREMTKSIEGLRGDLRANTATTQSLNTNLSNGKVGKMCAKVDRLFIAVMGLFVPLIGILAVAFEIVRRALK